MWLVFIFLLLVILIRIGLYFSKTMITINKINISENNDFEIDFKIVLYIFYKLKFITVRGDRSGLKIGMFYVSYNKIFKNMNVKKITKNTFFYRIKKLDLILDKMQGNLIIGTEELFLTVNIVAILSIVLGIIVGKTLIKLRNTRFKLKRNKRGEIKNKTNLSIRKYRYKIIPEFGKNIVKFEGNLSISFKTRRFGIFLRPKEHTKFKILVGG